MRALVFPGQGSQKVGMAHQMVQSWDWARELARRTDDVLGRPLTDLCFSGPEAELKKTVNTQPAIFFTSVLLIEAVRRAGLEFHAAAGHSLGEYAAFYAADVADYDDLLRLVDLRARAMEEACPAGTGAMTAIMMLDRRTIEEICQEASVEGPCVPANFNSPGQVVVSGAALAVQKVQELAKERGARRIIPLEVSGPFHSPLMAQARAHLAEAMAGMTFRTPQVPVYTNIDAAPTRQAAEIKGKLLDQVTGTVLWEDSVLRMHADGVRQFLELGPGKVVSGLIKKIIPDVELSFADSPQTLDSLLPAVDAHS